MTRLSMDFQPFKCILCYVLFVATIEQIARHADLPACLLEPHIWYLDSCKVSIMSSRCSLRGLKLVCFCAANQYHRADGHV